MRITSTAHRAQFTLSHRLRRIHRADQRTILGINQLIGTTAGGTQIHQIRRRLRVRPIPAVRPAAQIILLHQPVKQSLSMLAEQGKLLGTQRRLRRGSAQMRRKHVRVRRVEYGSFHVLPENRLRMMHQVRIQRIVPSDKHGERILTTATGTPNPLNKGCAGSGPTRHEHRIQPGNIDTQLKCRGTCQPEQFAGAQPMLKLTAFLGHIPRTIRRHPMCQPRLGLIKVTLRSLRDQLGTAPRPGEGKRAGAREYQVGEHLSALFNSGDALWCLLFCLGTGVEGARAGGELIGHLRIGQELRFPQDDGGFSAGRGRCGNRVNVPLGHSNELGERLGRVRTRGRCPIEYRAHPVERADSA